MANRITSFSLLFLLVAGALAKRDMPTKVWTTTSGHQLLTVPGLDAESLMFFKIQFSKMNLKGLNEPTAVGQFLDVFAYGSVPGYAKAASLPRGDADDDSWHHAPAYTLQELSDGIVHIIHENIPQYSEISGLIINLAGNVKDSRSLQAVVTLFCKSTATVTEVQQIIRKYPDMFTSALEEGMPVSANPVNWKTECVASGDVQSFYMISGQRCICRECGVVPNANGTSSSVCKCHMPVSVEPAELEEWDLCGGLGGHARRFGVEPVDQPYAGYSCSSGTTCQKLNAWTWQCLAPSAVDAISRHGSADLKPMLEWSRDCVETSDTSNWFVISKQRCQCRMCTYPKLGEVPVQACACDTQIKLNGA